MASTISKPDITLNIAPSNELRGLTEHKILVIGQKTASGSATAGQLVEIVLDNAQINTAFGRRSHIAQMLRAIRRNNRDTQVSAIALSDAGGAVAATATVTFTGTSTQAGSFVFEFVHGLDHRFTLNVASGAAPATMATDLAALVNADNDIPVTASANLGVVTLTFANAGTVGNGAHIAYSGAAAGVTVALTAFAGGANDPSLTGLFAPIDSLRYQTIVYPGSYDYLPLKQLINTRFNVENDVLDGIGIICKRDTLANLKTAASNFNLAGVSVFGERPVDLADQKGGHNKAMPDVVAAEFASKRGKRLTDGANLINDVVATNGIRDLRGGPSLSTLPYFNTPFENLPVARAGTYWSDIERKELQDAGVSSIGPNKSRQLTIADEVVTTYTTDVQGNPDTSFKFLNTVDASSVGREFQFNNAKARFAQARLTNGDIVSGFAMENKTTIRAFFLTLYRNLAELAVYQAGREAERAYSESLNVDVTLTTAGGNVTVDQAPRLVGQLRSLFGVIRVNF